MQRTSQRTSHRTYRALTLLYPREFRDLYRDDLVQSLNDLTDEFGASRAWGRTGLDLLVTVPRYRMETLMNQDHRSNALTGLIVMLGAAGIVSVPLGIAPGIVLLPIAVLLGITQRSRLARSMDVANGTHMRRRRLSIAAGLACSLPVIYLVSLPILGDSWGTDAVVAFSLWFVVLIAAVCYFIAGISTPKAPVTSR